MPISFDLTAEQKEMLEKIRKFAREELIPWADKSDRERRIPRELIEKMCKPPYSIPAIWIPKQYGGLELSRVSTTLLSEEVGYALTPALTFIEVSLLGTFPLIVAGSEEQKKKYLTRIAEGKAITAYALTDEGSGSDVIGGMNTRAEKVGDEYVLNGRKRWISYADIADIIIVFAKTDPAKGSRGISAFIVEKDTPGFTLVRPERCIGVRGHHAWEIAFKDCRIPKENLIGEEGSGIRIALMTLDDSRISLAAGNVGIAKAALDCALKFAAERKVFGKPLSEYQAISFALADIATRIEAARLLVWKAAWLCDAGFCGAKGSPIRHSKETAMAKLFACETAVKDADVAMNILGGYGVTEDYPVERYLRDAKAYIPAQGTSEIQRLIISRSLFRELEGKK